MIKEEALMQLKFILNYTRDGQIIELTDYSREAIRTVVDILSQEPCEDCVSREEVLKAFSYNHDYCDDYENAFLKSIGDTRKLPSVQPTMVHAKWVGSNGIDYKYFNSFIVCSNCRNHPKEFSVFCPNCGAQMDLEGNND